MNRLGEKAAARELAILRFIDRQREDGAIAYEVLRSFAQFGFGAKFLDSALADLVDLKYLGCHDAMYHITYLGEEVFRPAQNKGGTNG